jgi:hypothetical protein
VSSSSGLALHDSAFAVEPSRVMAATSGVGRLPARAARRSTPWTWTDRDPSPWAGEMVLFARTVTVTLATGRPGVTVINPEPSPLSARLPRTSGSDAWGDGGGLASPATGTVGGALGATDETGELRGVAPTATWGGRVEIVPAVPVGEAGLSRGGA